jgi:hypothetical protein
MREEYEWFLHLPQDRRDEVQRDLWHTISRERVPGESNADPAPAHREDDSGSSIQA